MDPKFIKDYIYGLSINARKNNPNYMKKLLLLMGSPHKEQKYIHVAGTNGKGSTVNYINNILIESGYKTALYTSPHIERLTERFKINNLEISQEHFIYTFEFVKKRVELMSSKGDGKPSIFEFLTAMAFKYFKDQCCDFIILETGMGGENDPTNIIDSVEVAVITKVGIDHVYYLGPTLDNIVKEKSGIIKGNSKVVLFSQTKLVEDIIVRKALSMNAELEIVNFPHITEVDQNLDKQVFTYKNIKNAETPMFGYHQVQNATIAIETALVLGEKGYDIDCDSIRRGLSVSKWSGRTEILSKSPVVILDGAHNEDGLITVCNSLLDFFKNKEITFVFGTHTNKNYTKMIDIMKPIAKHFYTFTPNYHNGLSGYELGNVIKKHTNNVTANYSLEEALNKVLKYSNKDDVICIVGSLFCIHDSYKFFNKYDNQMF